MQAPKKTILVTGSNKGIGFALVQALAREGVWRIIMACRNPKLGQEALEKIKSSTPNADVTLAELDVSNFESIDKFIEQLKSSNAQIDVHINNAAVLIRDWTLEALQSSFQTNFHGTVYLTEKIFPFISKDGKIITVSSTRAQFPNVLNSEELKKKWSKQDMTKEELLALVEEYVASIKDDTTEKIGYLVNKQRFFFYPATKLAISTFVRIFSRHPEIIQRNIQVYNLHPGYINTDMSLHRGPGTVKQGIDTLLYLIHLPFQMHKDFQGQLFENRVVVGLDVLETK